ncbi:MAG: hypothetical protein WBL63_17960 [Candidatus Acidiferrum sp.]
MDETQTGSILINLVDGTRQTLSNNVKWSATIHDGRSPDQWQIVNIDGRGSAELVKGLPYFNNPFDSYTVIVNAKGFEDAGWMPVHISPARPAQVDLMLLPKNGRLNFSGATWDAVNSLRPRFAQILSAGIGDAPTRYNNLMELPEGLVLGCLLNLLSAMSQITLPSEKSPLDYYWQPIWDDPMFAMAQDRFFAYVDKALVDDLVKACQMGSFSEEENPGALHPGATLSYKQTQFDVTNVQLTFHQGNAKTLQGPNGPVDCIVIEPDIDYYKDLLAHFFVEVLPNKLTGGLTDPRAVYLLRWMASKQAGSDFNPLYTMTV